MTTGNNGLATFGFMMGLAASQVNRQMTKVYGPAPRKVDPGKKAKRKREKASRRRNRG